jgi:beta-phosphoglucomutase-like phosphatase (HAD superfamily)
MDGTLVDSNYHHVIAWHRAFRAYDVTVPLWQVSRHMGMGGDKLVSAVAGTAVERAHGEALRKAWKANFGELIDEVAVLAGAAELLHAVADRGLTVVLASSGEPHHVEHFVDLLSARDVAAGWTTSGDVENTKPAPDLLEVALSKAGGGSAITFCEAAGRLDLPTVALRTGGFGLDELRAAGARHVYDSLDDVRSALDTVLRR